MLRWLFNFAFLLSLLWLQPASSQPLSSAQSSTGIWDMPTARVLPDWTLRIHHGRNEPFRYYGVALGLWDRLEFHGQFTEQSNALGFSSNPEYGYYKDRNAGARLVLIKEDELWPQVAIGTYDPIGTLLYPTRYLVSSKMIGNWDLTLGLGQGLLGGESLNDIERDKGLAEAFDTGFLLSTPLRQTKIFGGFEYHFNPDFTLSAEYSTIKYEGYRFSPGKARSPINLGFKYQVLNHLYLQAGYMRGEEINIGITADMPLNPEAILPWKKEGKFKASERLRWQFHQANNQKIAQLLAYKLADDGFGEVTTSVNDEEIWVEFVNSKYLSNAKALGRVARIIDDLSPPRIQTFYLNMVFRGQIFQSFKASRDELNAFMEYNIDKNVFLQVADLSMFSQGTIVDFPKKNNGNHREKYNKFNWNIAVKVKTFLNNKAGFFKHKIYVRPRLFYYPWHDALLSAELEFPFLNEWTDLIYGSRESEPVRTDLVSYEKRSRPRISELAFNQHLQLPQNVLGRFSVGIFENAYAGIGAEVFRYFADGLFGAGLEAELVRKRDPDNNFKLHEDIDKTYKTYFLNLYGQLWPSQGLDAGLKIGHFLGGDVGYSLELRRSFKYFTLGGWYTSTNTDHFTSSFNRGSKEKGVFIIIPMSIFTDHDQVGTLGYSFSSFTKDTGQSVRQPSALSPINPYHSLGHTRRNLEDMRSR